MESKFGGQGGKGQENFGLDQDNSRNNGHFREVLSPLLLEIKKKYRKLEVDEQESLVELAQKGDLEARDKLILHGLGLVTKVASRFRWFRGVSFDDLVQEGILGFIKAIDSYDFKNASLSTYATMLIRQFIDRFVQKYSQTVRLSINKQENKKAIRRISGKFLTQFGRVPEIDEIAMLLGKNPTSLERSARSIVKSVYLDDLLKDKADGEDLDYIAAYQDKNYLDPSLKITAWQELERRRRDIQTLLTHLHNLPKKRRRIFCSFYGLDDSLEQKTLDSVGKEWGLTRERIRQIIQLVWFTLPRYQFWKDEKWLQETISQAKILGELLHFSSEKELCNYLANQEPPGRKNE